MIIGGGSLNRVVRGLEPSGLGASMAMGEDPIRGSADRSSPLGSAFQPRWWL
jgi:hypothetical protein